MFPTQKFALQCTTLSFLVCVVLVLFYNSSLWSLVFAETHIRSGFFLSFFAFITAALCFILTFVSFRYLQKPMLITLIFISAGVNYFMHQYGIVFDKNMIQNVAETDLRETLDLLSTGFMFHMLVYAVLPAVLIGQVKVRYGTPVSQIKRQCVIATISLSVIAVSILPFFKTYSSLARNHKEIRGLIVPTNYLYYGSRYLAGAYIKKSAPLVKIGLDSKKGDLWNHQPKRVVMILVVGETARASSFSLNGYHRDTNPKLQKQDVINFSNVTSCGTSTAVSLPCMFSDQGRKQYSQNDARSRENVLDILSRAGIDILWSDNNSGCKGVCDRLNGQPVDTDPRIECKTRECFDEDLLEGLDRFLSARSGDALIVLHQKGSHGPAYSERYPQKYAVFQPTCDTTDLQACNQQQIINTYDNTIVYTDYFLTQVIEYLKARSDQYTAAMLYISDHGESLGENNIFLHGLPYFIAPDEQKHVPMLIWLSDAYKDNFKISDDCLQQQSAMPLSHDNIYHSLLGLMAVETSDYSKNMDLVGQCRRGSMIMATR